jgi:hypothetical protein
MSKQREKPGLLSDRRVAERYDVVTRTLQRWDEQPELEFSKPIYIRRRRYRAIAALDKWDRANARRAAAPKAARDPRRHKPAHTALET